MPTIKNTPTPNRSLNARFVDRVALITAGASGIGAATARQLHAEGASVVIGDINTDGMDRIAKEFDERFLGIRCDATQERDVEDLMKAVINKFGRIDVTCCVAGGGVGDGQIVDLDEASWRRSIDSSLTTTFLTIKHSARHMIDANRGGAIVNVSSICAQIPLMTMTGYSCAKAGVEMLTELAALQLGEYGIRVNAVAPGRVATPRTAKTDAATGHIWTSRTPLGRIGRPEELAAGIAFLASDDAAFISGAILNVDGALSTAAFKDMVA